MTAIKRAAPVLALAALMALVPAFDADAKQRSKRVAADYFGVAYPLMRTDPPEVRERELEAIAGAGLASVRRSISWRDLQPDDPAGREPDYIWTLSDLEVRQLAEHGLQMQPAFLLSPGWAAGAAAFPCELTDQASGGTDRSAEYADAAAALVARYGPGGTFWAEHPELAPRPIRTWEIWNEPNVHAFWCPEADPAAYAEMFVQAATAIRRLDPSARVITGGLALRTGSGRYTRPGDFLAAALRYRPELWAVADGVGVHMFPSGPLKEQLVVVHEWRELLRGAGVPDTEPMYASEVGWGLPGAFELTEQTRAQRYRYFMQRISSSTCNVAMVVAHAWTTAPPGQPVHDENAGIADRETGELFPSAIAYRNAIALMRGKRRREAPHKRVPTCPGMPKLDRDGDRVAEHRDYYPLNSRKWRGPARWYGKRGPG